MLISEQKLALSRALPTKPDPVILSGKSVNLVPLDKEKDVKSLFDVSNGSSVSYKEQIFPSYDPNELIWKYLPYGPFDNLDGFSAYIDGIMNRPNSLMFCIRDKASDIPIGTISFVNNFPEHLRIEIGAVWVSPVAQRSGVISESVFLMGDYTLRVLGYRRLEWGCRVMNLRANKFAVNFGFKEDVLFEEWGIFEEGAWDCQWYRIFDFEWEEIRKRWV